MNILEKLFRTNKRTKERLELTGYQPVFTAWSGNAYANDTLRGGIDAIARNFAKMKPTHIVTFSDGSSANGNTALNTLLQIAPNPYMSTYDVLYKAVTTLYLYNNAFIYIARNDAGKITALYPLNVSHCEFLVDETGAIYTRFIFANGKEYTLSYNDVAHLRRHFANNDLLGEDNGAIESGIELAHTQNEGIIQGIKTGVTLRGLLHFTQILSPDKLRENKERFESDYLSMSNSGGIVATDESATYTPIENKAVAINSADMQATAAKIYDYLGITENIVNSSYTDENWSAFYESTIEPLAVQMSLELTRKMFTPAQIARGNSIELKANRLQFISNSNKISLLKEIMPMGLLTTNQALDVLGLPPVADGERRIQSLNYIDQSIATEYQLANGRAITRQPEQETETEGDTE